MFTVGMLPVGWSMDDFDRDRLRHLIDYLERVCRESQLLRAELQASMDAARTRGLTPPVAKRHRARRKTPRLRR
jgi:hypothetical protein